MASLEEMRMNYRERYEERICKIPTNFEIHHLDLNRKNNNIDNLLMLPKEVHRNLHHILQILPDNIEITPDIRSQLEGGSQYLTYIKTGFIQYIEIMGTCNMWKDYKMFCIGELPNIHKITEKELYGE